MKKYIVFIGLLVLGLGICVFAEDLVWENIGRQILDVNVILVDRLNPKYIYVGTKRGIFKSEDGGSSFRPDTRLNKNINFLLQDKQNIVYAATIGGLFISCDQGESWKRIFRGRNSKENNCWALAILKEGEIYLGTDAGLFMSKDKGRSWHKQSGELGNIPILSMAVDELNKIIYVASANKIFKLQNGFTSYTKIFTASSGHIDNETNNEEENSREESVVNLNYIAVDPNMPNHLYLATERGVYVSQDQGLTWNSMSDFGLLSKKVKFLLLSKSSILYVVSQSGIFVYKNDRWQELSLRLLAEDIRFLTIDNQDNLYAATDKGIFRVIQQNFLVDAQDNAKYFKDEPTVKELHKAAIEYAQVIDPRRIENLRKQARVKAILPKLNLDYDRTITSYSNATTTRFEVGPADWGVSLSWNLSDIIWSEQQRLIDSQVRLMVTLRNDILDEVNKLYFERRKVKIELAHLSLQDSKKIWEKKLRLEELTASLDALTGGYFSQHLKD